MRIYYDAEFIDNGETIELISIGMVREDGKKYYAVVQDLGIMIRAWKNVWLRENVLRFLPVEFDDWTIEWNSFHEDWQHVKTREQIKKEILSFIRETVDVELWAWYAAYDHVVLAQIFGKMIDLPEDVPMYTMDLKQEHHRLGFPRLPEQMSGAHNALADAQWNRTVGDYLSKFEDGNA